MEGGGMLGNCCTVGNGVALVFLMEKQIGWETSGMGADGDNLSPHNSEILFAGEAGNSRHQC